METARTADISKYLSANHGAGLFLRVNNYKIMKRPSGNLNPSSVAGNNLVPRAFSLAWAGLRGLGMWSNIALNECLDTSSEE